MSHTNHTIAIFVSLFDVNLVLRASVVPCANMSSKTTRCCSSTHCSKAKTSMASSPHSPKIQEKRPSSPPQDVASMKAESTESLQTRQHADLCPATDDDIQTDVESSYFTKHIRPFCAVQSRFPWQGLTACATNDTDSSAEGVFDRISSQQCWDIAINQTIHAFCAMRYNDDDDKNVNAQLGRHVIFPNLLARYIFSVAGIPNRLAFGYIVKNDTSSAQMDRRASPLIGLPCCWIETPNQENFIKTKSALRGLASNATYTEAVDMLSQYSTVVVVTDLTDIGHQMDNEFLLTGIPFRVQSTLPSKPKVEQNTNERATLYARFPAHALPRGIPPASDVVKGCPTMTEFKTHLLNPSSSLDTEVMRQIFEVTRQSMCDAATKLLAE